MNHALIITEYGKASSMDNAIRVLLSRARNALRMQDVHDIVQFGIYSTVIPWNNENDEELEALCLQRLQNKRHIFTEFFQREAI